MNAESINDLVHRAQEGDKEAFRQLILGLQYELQHFISARASNYDMIEEIL